MRFRSSFLPAGFLLLVCAAAVFGQAQIGSLLFGTITDSHGAVIGGAKVVFTMPAIGASRSVTTADDGTFVFPQITAGEYEITVSKEGFKTAKQSGIEVHVNESVRANVQMEVGSISTTVEVKGQA